MSKILFVIEFGGFSLPLEDFRKAGHEVEFAKNMRKAVSLLNKMQPDLLAAEFNYTSQFRDRDSNLDTILTQIESRSPHTRVVAFVEEEQRPHFERFKSRFPQIQGELYFPFESDNLLSLVDVVLQ
ncbi:MAG: hypothetical protein EP297_10985 [Gammaproteobacteria bacterium]|nr:MAG: hypothetical protein EP297_10985 [Gammaproteobacteria bacterium]